MQRLECFHNTKKTTNQYTTQCYPVKILSSDKKENFKNLNNDMEEWS